MKTRAEATTYAETSGLTAHVSSDERSLIVLEWVSPQFRGTPTQVRRIKIRDSRPPGRLDFDPGTGDAGIVVGAILRREFLGSGRKPRFYVLRTLYVALLSVITVSALMNFAVEIALGGGFRGSHGYELAERIGALQMVLVILVSPAISATAVTGEKASGVLELLLASGARPIQIVFGKLVARTLWIVIGVASGLPLLAVSMLLGGAGLETILLYVSHTIAAAALGSSLGILVSGMFRRTVPALLAAYAVQLSFYVLPLLVARWALWAYNPGIATYSIVLSAPIAVSAATSGLISSTQAWLALVPPLAGAMLLFFASIPFARPVHRAGALETASVVGVALLEGSRTEIRRLRAGTERRSATVGGNPVAWREARTHRHAFGSRVLRLGYVIVGGALAIHLLLFAVLDGNEPKFARFGVTVLALGAGAMALVVSSTTVASERESGSYALLQLSELRSIEILAGKTLGLASYLWPVIVLPAIPALAFLPTEPISFLLSLLVAVVLVLGGSGIGFFFSAICRRASTSLIAALGVVVAWAGLVPIPILWLAKPSQAQILLPLAHPVASVVAVVTGFRREPAADRYWYGPDPLDFHQSEWAGWIGLAIVGGVGVASLLIASNRLSRVES